MKGANNTYFFEHKSIIFTCSVLAVFIILNLAISETVFSAQKKAADKKKAVTYPDVWGIELPLPDKEIDSASPSAIYEDEHGDIIVKYAIFYEDKHHVRLVSFFTRKLLYEYFYTSEKEITKETRSFMKKLKKLKKITSGLSPIIFSDGSKLMDFSIDLGKAHPANTWIEKYDKKGEKIFSRTYLLKLEKPFKHNVLSVDNISDGSSDGPVPIHIVPLYFYRFWKLKDGTYILDDIDKTTLIRFRADLSSPYIENNHKFLVVDADLYKQKYHDFFIDVLEEEPIQTKQLPSGKWEVLWKDNCKSRVECFDKKLSTFFDEEQKKLQGGE